MMKRSAMQHRFFAVLPVFIVIIAFAVLLVIPRDVSAETSKPVARIDGTLNVKQGKTVYLDGSFSSDPGGANLDYQWTLLSLPSGSLATLGSSGSQVSFEADVAGTYKVKLIVTNGLTESDPAYAEIRVTEGQ
jgi:hypothetical protein